MFNSKNKFGEIIRNELVEKIVVRRFLYGYVISGIEQGVF
jgi:hypothetical protein